MNEELLALQAVRLKGRPTRDAIAEATGIKPELLADVLATLTGAGHLEFARDRAKLTATGRERLDALARAERATIDQACLADAYHDFDTVNTEFKQLVTDWQLIDGIPNDHSDPEYDHRIIQRLAGVHERLEPLLTRLVGIAPRLAGYPRRFSAALAKVLAGDHGWLAKPLIDSYHTVWFELHEDLIALAGLSRAAEAAAGRAQ